jgi:phosphate-selective porin OprO/OprP
VGTRRESAVANSLLARTGPNPAKSASTASSGNVATPFHWRLSSAIGLVATLAAGSAGAQSTSGSADPIDKMQAQIKALELEVQALKRKQGVRQDTTTPSNATPNRGRKNPGSSDSVVAKRGPGAADGTRAAATPLAKTPDPTAVVKMSKGNRPSICTADGLNCLALTSRLHIDIGGYKYRPNTAATTPQGLDNGVNARRARIGFQGTFMGDWNYALTYDFGGSSDGLPPVSGAPISGLQLAYISYTGFKPFAVEVGYQDLPYSLQEATSSNDPIFMELPSAQVVAANIAAGNYRSSAGIRGNDDRLWAGVYLTGPTSGTTHIAAPTATAAGSPGTVGSPGFAEQIGAFGRLTYQLWQDQFYSLHVGGDAEFLLRPPGNGTLTLSDRPELRIDPTPILSTGAIANIAHAQVYSAEAAAGAGSLFFQGEYFWFNVERALHRPPLQFNGGYAEASWTITGERRKYNPDAGAYFGVVPDHPFSWAAGEWGAWAIAARYSYMNLNDLVTRGVPTSVTFGAAGGVQSVYTFGLNWYVNRNVRLLFDYLHGRVDKFNGVAPNVGADTGAKFDALAVRTQVYF